MSKDELKKIKVRNRLQTFKLPEHKKQVSAVMVSLERMRIFNHDIKILKVYPIGTECEQLIHLGKTLEDSIDEQLKKYDIGWDNISGIVITIIGNKVVDAPVSQRSKICPFCEGNGCRQCQGTGYKPPVVHNAVIRGVVENI